MLKKIVISSLIMAGLSISAMAQSAPSVTVVGTIAPNAYGSPSFDQWSQNAISGLENNQNTVGGPGPTQYNAVTGPLPITANNVTGFPSWLSVANPPAPYANEYGNRATFDVLINGNGSTINLADLSFNSSSTDPGNSLGFSFGPGNDPFTTYDSTDIGLIFGAGGSVTVLNNGQDASTPVDEIISVGAGNAQWPDYGVPDPGTAAGRQAIIDAYDATVSPYDYTGDFSIDGVTGGATIDFTAVPDSGGAMMNVLALAGLLGFGLKLQKKPV